MVAVYRSSGGGFGSLTEIACMEFGEFTVDFTAMAGRTYFFQVGSRDGKAGPMEFGLFENS